LELYHLLLILIKFGNSLKNKSFVPLFVIW